MAKGWRVTTASRKMIVKPARRMLSAISFGVFCRSAPSTSAIIRSRKVSPGRAVIRTTISSDRTRVPPVTAQRSPPDSRMTGADSPVMADSSTLAMPSTTSPSLGITSPAVTTHSSPTWRSLLGTSSIVPCGVRRRAIVSERVLRRVAAWALPRPSAIASAKLANSTVNHRKSATSPVNTFSLPVAEPMSRTNRIVVSTLPTSTTNMTGLRAWTRGWSLRKLSTSAPRTMAGSNKDLLGRGWRSRALLPTGRVTVSMWLLQTQMLDDGTEREGGEEREAGDDEGDADHHAAEQRRVGREGPRRRGRRLLAGHRAGDGEHRDDEEEPADEHRQPQRRVVPVGGGRESGEGRAVVVRRRRERVEDLRQPVRPRIVHCVRRLQDDRGRGEPEQGHGHRQHVQHDHLHLDGLDLLAQILGRPSHHQAGDEHRQDHHDQQAVEADTDTPGTDLAQHDVRQRHHPPEGCVAVVHGVHRPVRRTGGGHRPQGRCAGAEPDFLAL